MTTLRITGGKVYDPANGVDGVVKDICIADGRIVAEVDGGRTIDATGMIVFPGGVDIHTHVAGAALNFARGMTPENHRRAAPVPARPGAARRARRARRPRHSPPATSTPGWATRPSTRPPCRSCRPSTPTRSSATRPSWTRRACVLMANNEIVLDLLEAGELERAKHVVAWLIWAAKAYGVKAVNPGGVAGLEVGQGRQGPVRAGGRLQQGDARGRSSPAWPRSSTSWVCRTRCICTATTSASPATSPRPSRR